MQRFSSAKAQMTVGEMFLDYLASSGALDAQARQRVHAAMMSSGESVDTVLLELGLLPEIKLADAQAAYLGLARVYANEFPQELLPDAELPHEFVRSAGLLPLVMNDTTVTVATARPFETDAIRGLGHFFGKEAIPKVANSTELVQHIQKLFAAENADVISTFDQAGLADEDDVERLKDVAREAPIIKLLNRIISAATEQNASDIHIEPMEDHVQVRYRVDGSLTIADRLPKPVQQGLISRVKILARLNIAEHRLPQDGRIQLPVRGNEIEFRVSTTPVTFGESVALRVLDRQQIQLDYSSLGYLPKDAATLHRLTSHHNGIFLVTGPTGSGKTTTLYAAMNALNQPQVKLFTVEDPVEYRLKGVNQIQVKPAIGLDFAAVLRSVLRQDPDVIMVGEIRDAETAKIAVQASLTGHLVLSTLHTNSAAASVTRLLDMGLEDYLLASTLRGIVAQRLLRKLCGNCKTDTYVDNAIKSKLNLSQIAPIYKSGGCPKCNDTGFKGRTVAYEILEIGEDQRNAIVNRLPESEIHALAVRDGMSTLYRTAMDCVERGETSLEEVYRVIQGPTL
jgi:general secretion pathway protein E